MMEGDRNMNEVYELMQILMDSDKAFNYCYQYFIEDVWDLRAEAHDSGTDERLLLARYMASWIPWEPCAERLIAQVRELADE